MSDSKKITPQEIVSDDSTDSKGASEVTQEEVDFFAEFAGKISSEKEANFFVNARIEEKVIEGLRLHNLRVKQNNEQRLKFSDKIYNLVYVWLGLVLFFVALDAIKSPNTFASYFRISDSVMIALISSLSVNILLLLTIVIRNLFPVKSEKNLIEKLKELSSNMTDISS